MTTITALPPAPSRTDPDTFSSKSDALLGALDQFVTETNAVASEVNASATTASNSATAAAASALIAGATVWVSGTTYAIGDARYSPIDLQTYRRKTNGAGTTDPSADSTNWAQAVVQELRQTIKSTAYTTVLADSGTHILHPSADTTARTFTIDSNANVPYPIGTAITFVNQAGAGTLTIAITSDTMRLAVAGTTGSRTLSANGIATALKITSTEWIISGVGLV